MRLMLWVSMSDVSDWLHWTGPRFICPHGHPHRLDILVVLYRLEIGTGVLYPPCSLTDGNKLTLPGTSQTGHRYSNAQNKDYRTKFAVKLVRNF